VNTNTPSLKKHQDKAKEWARPLRTETERGPVLLHVTSCHFGTRSLARQREGWGVFEEVSPTALWQPRTESLKAIWDFQLISCFQICKGKKVGKWCREENKGIVWVSGGRNGAERERDREAKKSPTCWKTEYREVSKGTTSIMRMGCFANS